MDNFLQATNVEKIYPQGRKSYVRVEIIYLR